MAMHWDTWRGSRRSRGLLMAQKGIKRGRSAGRACPCVRTGRIFQFDIALCQMVLRTHRVEGELSGRKRGNKKITLTSSGGSPGCLAATSGSAEAGVVSMCFLRSISRYSKTM